ncbi:alpha-ketoglutarate-dependent dioxygenase AlkB [Pelagibacterium xiamenense]|uniref:alpha-ketoglutarate-dependent dioxygenase AlkB n=1 Tax=Pelagibacterium xiamenense TaxID=2901140 RepID=UPI001E28726D|nr:alpha-ketoglutarate-dependent dioxygenase AlkB [Pelagibacterium xiamenense]MCD7060679.1 alpha-ketoglutarate-dependent dioxygenase AlkB [Pelagibacterium xiamenense]
MLPPAAHYLPDYIGKQHEASLLRLIDDQPWLTDLKRRVQHYGFRYDYKSRRVTHDAYLGPLPDWLEALADRLWRDRIFDQRPDQIIINEYQPGQGIAPHIDCQPCFGKTIASLSLGSACVMEFTQAHSGRATSRLLHPRSLLVLHDDARFSWKHGIPARKTDVIDGLRFERGRRLSLTFRTVILDL